MTLSLKNSVSDLDKHVCNASVLVQLGDRILSGSDDGILKIWTLDLKLISEVNTNAGGILSIAVGPKCIYTCTADETVKSWDKATLKHISTLTTSLLLPQKAFFEPSSNILWVGDSQGRVAKFEDDKEVGKFELTEEIWDLYVTATTLPLVFTSRDRDTVVFEIVKGELRSNAVVKATMEGRYPLTMLKDFVCCLNRDGRQIQVHENSVASKFKLLREIPAANMIINAICPSGETTVFVGGYDAEISAWDVTTGQSKGAVSVGSCVNALAPAADHGVYAALTSGKIVHIDY